MKTWLCVFCFHNSLTTGSISVFFCLTQCWCFKIKQKINFQIFNLRAFLAYGWSNMIVLYFQIDAQSIILSYELYMHLYNIVQHLYNIVQCMRPMSVKVLKMQLLNVKSNSIIVFYQISLQNHHNSEKTFHRCSK